MKLISVLRVGLGPGAPGKVLIFVTEVPHFGGIRLAMLNLINDFFTGIMPVETSDRRPSTFMDTSYSVNLTMLRISVFSGFYSY